MSLLYSVCIYPCIIIVIIIIYPLMYIYPYHTSCISRKSG
jgi:hypothetical protein